MLNVQSGKMIVIDSKTYKKNKMQEDITPIHAKTEKRISIIL